MIHIEIIETGEQQRIEQEVWITWNRNGPVVTPHRVKALGVGDGERIWSLGALEGWPEARIITFAEYLELHAIRQEDPELTDRKSLDIIMGGCNEIE